MALQHRLPIADQRPATPRLSWLTLEAPELARGARAGQYLLARCAEEGSSDPLLRRLLFVAAAEPALGQVGLLYEPSEPGMAALARRRRGETLDVIGPLGRSFALNGRARNLLLIGAGPGIAALLLLAREGASHGCTITLLAGATHPDLLPPSFLIPADVEYQTVIGSATDLLLGSPRAASLSPIMWADQIYAALPNEQLPALRDAIRKERYRWERGFANALLQGPIVCGVGACGVCGVELRKGLQLLCSDGPVFDLRDVLRDA